MLRFNVNYFAQLSCTEISVTKHKRVQTKGRMSPFKGTAGDMK